MKIILINAPYLFVYRSLNVGKNYYFPLGIGYIAAVLKKNGFDVKILDPEPINYDEKDIRRYLHHEQPDIVGISCATSNFNSASIIARMAKEVTDAKVIIGGIHATVMYEEILHQHPQFDAVVVGEGEFTLLEICLRYQETGKWDLQGIHGTAYLDCGRMLKNPNRPLIRDLDSLPAPARELVDISRYRSQVHLYRGRRTASIISSRGCPFGCSFCASFNTMGRSYRTHSPQYVLNEIQCLYETYGIRDFIFVDDEFTVKNQRTRELCQLIIDSKLDIGWYCFARVNDVDRELLSLMKQAGCFSINFGIESADPEILKNMNKKITLEQVENALSAANKLGLKTVAGYLFGNMGETLASMQKTTEFALRVSPAIATFNIMVPFPGTRDYDRLKKKTPHSKDNWDNFVPTEVNDRFASDQITPRQLRDAVRRAYIKFYLRPSQVLLLLRHVKSLNECLAMIKGMLGILLQAYSWKVSGQKER